MRDPGIFSKVLGRLSMAFPDRKKEERFLGQQRDDTARNLRWACGIGAAIMIGFIWQDVFLSSAGYKAILIRIFGAIPVAALARYLSRSLRARRFVSYISAFFWLSYACLTMAIFISYGPGPNGLTSFVGLGSYLIILIGVFTFSNLRLWASILVGLCTLLIYTFSIALWTDAVFVDFIMDDLLTIVVLIVAMAMKTLFTERAQRQQFETSELLQKFYDTVEQKVRERTAELHVMNKQLSAEIAGHGRADYELKSQLAQKEVLLKEVHHRVKNNMQVITSLLRMQARGVKDPVHAELFKDSMNRVKSMALVHEELYQSKDLLRVEFGDYISKLASNLFATYQLAPDGVKMVLDIENVDLDVTTAIPLGLIINELLSNSLKYAFPGDRKGSIFISLKKIIARGENMELVVKDDGVGLFEAFDPAGPKTLGMQLLASLPEQLKGKMEQLPGPGTGFRLVFPSSTK